ncbi:MAG: HNH endonuclease signature motif containing protein [Candidatus Binatia bacterium]|nr:HNH endonuclease signature motif containing protein [Candidatus Binatia bacterium]
MVRIVAQVQPEEAAIVMKALEVARAAAAKSAGDVSAETSEGLSERLEGERRATADQGGPTSLTNLVSLCRRHHRFMHELGWRVEGRLDVRLADLERRITVRMLASTAAVSALARLP